MGLRSQQTHHQKIYTNRKKGYEDTLHCTIISDMKIKTIVRLHYTPIRMAKIQNAEEDVEQQRSSYIANGNANEIVISEDSVCFYKTKFTLITQFNNCTPWCLLKGVEDLCPQIR